MEGQNSALGGICEHKDYFLVPRAQSSEGQIGLEGLEYARAAAYMKADVSGEPDNSETWVRAGATKESVLG